jgi:hypothetical protein
MTCVKCGQEKDRRALHLAARARKGHYSISRALTSTFFRYFGKDHLEYIYRQVKFFV